MKIEVMLCIKELPRFLKTARSYRNIYWSAKIDGLRCWNIIDKGKVRYFSRNGLEYKNFGVFDEDNLKIYENLKNQFGLRDPVILDSEITTSDKKFRRVMTQAHRIRNVDTSMLESYIFDVALSNKPYIVRYRLLERTIDQNELKKVFLLRHYPLNAKNEIEIKRLMMKMVRNGFEGIVLNTMDGPYEFGKRSVHCCKVKPIETIDVKVVGVEYGTGRNAGRLGALICEYEGGRVKVGSGYNDKEREEFIKNPPKVIEIQFKEKTPGGSLREPVFIRVRDDKNINGLS